MGGGRVWRGCFRSPCHPTGHWGGKGSLLWLLPDFSLAVSPKLPTSLQRASLLNRSQVIRSETTLCFLSGSWQMWHHCLECSFLFVLCSWGLAKIPSSAGPQAFSVRTAFGHSARLLCFSPHSLVSFHSSSSSASNTAVLQSLILEMIFSSLTTALTYFEIFVFLSFSLLNLKI